MTNFKDERETTGAGTAVAVFLSNLVDLTPEIEYHDLRSTKDAKDCWLEIKYYPCWEIPITKYHYTSLKEDNNGCYIIEYV